MDDANKKQDDVMVDLHDTEELEYLHFRFPDKSRNQINEAIIAAGPYRKDIIKYLEGS